MSPSILLIIPYFGKFNNYFPFFLESCKNNPTINWLILTDDRTEYNFPSNVKVSYTTFKELKDRIQQLFQFQISLDRPYKLCDFKPAYGLIFSDEIQGYDFWGYCDSDLIFGDIRSFITDEIIEGKEKVLSRGHLSLYRNNDYLNNFFQTHTQDFYHTVYTNPKGFSFDEWGRFGIANHLKRELSEEKFWDGLPFDDILTTSSNFKPAQKLDKGYLNSVYLYENGKLTRFYQTTETGNKILSTPVLYAHFQKRPLRVETSDTDRFMIIPNKIINPVAITTQSVRKLGREKIINYQYIRIKYANLKRRLKL